MATYQQCITYQAAVTTIVYAPWAGQAENATPGIDHSLVVPFGGTITLDIWAYSNGNPGTMTLRLRRNGSATDLDTGTVTGFPTTVQLAGGLSSSGWTAGDFLQLAVSQTTANQPITFGVEFSNS